MLKTLLSFASVFLYVVHWGLLAQNAPGQLKGYRTNEEYCAENPTMPTCIKGKPLNLDYLKVNPMGTARGVAQPKPRAAETVRNTRISTARPAPIVKPAMIKLGEPDWRFAHPNADIMGGVKIKALMGSGFANGLLQQLAGSFQLKESDLSKLHGSMAGLDEICFSKKGDDLLLLMTGDVNKLEQMGGIPRGMRLQVISLDQALMGKEASILASARRLSVVGNTAESSATQRARKLAGANDTWVTGSMRGFGPAGVRASSEVTDFSVTLNMRDKLQIDAVLNTTSPAAAERIIAAMKAGRAPAEFSPTVDVQGSAVRMSVAVSQDQIAEGLKKASADPRFAGLAGALRHGQASATAPAPERTDGKVKIIGLPDGPREIELK